MQSRLAERGGKLRPTPFSPDSLSMRPLATCCGASYGSRPPRWVPPGGLTHSDLASRARVRMGGGKDKGPDDRGLDLNPRIDYWIRIGGKRKTVARSVRKVHNVRTDISKFQTVQEVPTNFQLPRPGMLLMRSGI